MSKYLTYYIKALEDVKITETIVQKESEQSLDYITGSSIRGAYIYKYISHYNIKNINEGEHRNKLLKGDINFLNAYPVYDDERAVPFPKCYFCPKEKIRGAEYLDYINLSLGLDNDLEDGFEKARFSEFVALDGNDYERVKVDKISNLHISKRTDKNKLFRYEAIKKGQVFMGIIKSQEESYLQEVKELLEDTSIYIGSSKGSGYGKCYIYDMEICEESPEKVQFEDMNDYGEYIYLIALSDIIYRTKLGEYKTIVDEDLLKKELSLENVEFVDSCIETKNVTSFNNKWNCSLPQIVAIKGGSVFKYRVNGEIDEELLYEFIDKGIGERKIDGFGRFIIVDELDDATYYLSKEKNKKEFNVNSMLKNLKEDDKSQLENIFTRIYENRVEDHIGKTVLKIYGNIKNASAMSNNQWGKLLELFSLMQFMDVEKGKEKFKDYMNHLEEKRSTSIKQLERIKSVEQDFIKYIKNFVEKSDDVNEFYKNTAIDSIAILNIKSIENSNFIYKTNIKILEELCKYHLRKEEKIK